MICIHILRCSAESAVMRTAIPTHTKSKMTPIFKSLSFEAISGENALRKVYGRIHKFVVYPITNEFFTLNL